MTERNLNGWINPALRGRAHVGRLTARGRTLGSFDPHVRLTRPAEVYDQAAVGSCVAQACAFGAVMVAMRQGYPAERPDRTDLYGVGRQAIGTIGEDSGCVISDVLEGMKQRGWRRETRDPSPIFDESYLSPPLTLPADAPKLVNYEPLAHDLATVLWELLCGHPVVVGLRITEQWERPGEVIGPPAGEVIGGHAVCLVGYQRDANGVQVRVRNSWSESFGDHGEVWLDASWLGLAWMGEAHALRAIRRAA